MTSRESFKSNAFNGDGSSSTYTQSPGGSPPASGNSAWRKVFIRNLPKDITEDKLRSLLNPSWIVEDLLLATDTKISQDGLKATKSSKGSRRKLAWVLFESCDDAVDAWDSLDKTNPWPQHNAQLLCVLVGGNDLNKERARVSNDPGNTVGPSSSSTPNGSSNSLSRGAGAGVGGSTSLNGSLAEVPKGGVIPRVNSQSGGFSAVGGSSATVTPHNSSTSFALHNQNNNTVNTGGPAPAAGPNLGRTGGMPRHPQQGHIMMMAPQPQTGGTLPQQQPMMMVPVGALPPQQQGLQAIPPGGGSQGDLVAGSMVGSQPQSLNSSQRLGGGDEQQQQQTVGGGIPTQPLQIQQQQQLPPQQTMMMPQMMQPMPMMTMTGAVPVMMVPVGQPQQQPPQVSSATFSNTTTSSGVLLSQTPPQTISSQEPFVLQPANPQQPAPALNRAPGPTVAPPTAPVSQPLAASTPQFTLASTSKGRNQRVQSQGQALI